MRTLLTSLLLLVAAMPGRAQDTTAARAALEARLRAVEGLLRSVDSVPTYTPKPDPEARARTRALQGPWVLSLRPDSARPAYTITATFHVVPDGPPARDRCHSCVEATLPASFVASLPQPPHNGRLWLAAPYADSVWLVLGWAGDADDGGWRGRGLLTTAGASGECWRSGYVDLPCGTWTLRRPEGWVAPPALPN